MKNIPLRMQISLSLEPLLLVISRIKNKITKWFTVEITNHVAKDLILFFSWLSFNAGFILFVKLLKYQALLS